MYAMHLTCTTYVVQSAFNCMYLCTCLCPGTSQYATPPTQLGPGSQQQVMGVGPSYQATPSLTVTGAGIPTPGTTMGMGPGGMGMSMGGPLGRAVTGPEVQLSGKHDGLWRYLSRLL